MKRTLGTCYYPEHWPRTLWEEDADRMAQLGLTWVRIGEFAWSKLEPEPGALDFDWLEDAIGVLGRAGLKVVVGTPTATPPRWIIDRHPDMLAHDADGRPRGFGSRRHYCFSHEGYREECARIVTLLAEAFGANPHVAAWQTDNEYGCHDTTISYSTSARVAFRNWLRAKYAGRGNAGDIEALNQDWGNVFWSMEYSGFEEIDLPNLTVTEPNPAHALAFRQFSSDQVVSFNRLQVDIIRQYSDAPIAHNYMGRITDFDHFDVGTDLDIASWDSYPLGFLEDRVGATAAHQTKYSRAGDPDFQALHHDLYRAVGRGRWWVMEQQPGPVNWAPYNPAPLPGMVRLWTWEAFAHGAEAVCYFRWRQFPKAQEQLHTGLLRPDSAEAPAFGEAAEVAREIRDAPDVTPVRARVAIVFDYAAEWAWTVQPHGAGLSYFGVIFDHYKALRKLGISLDILPPCTRDFSGYDLVLAPGLMHIPGDLKAALARADATVIIGPRSGAKDAYLATPVPLPPAIPGIDLTVTRTESLRPDCTVALKGGGALERFREFVETNAMVLEEDVAGEPVVMAQDNLRYVAALLDEQTLVRVLRRELAALGIGTIDLPDGLRTRETGGERFWFNHTDSEIQFDGRSIPAAGVLREAI